MGPWWVSTWAAPPPMSSACQLVLALRIWSAVRRPRLPASRCWHRGCRFIRLPLVVARSSAPRSSACRWGPVPLVLIQGLLVTGGAGRFASPMPICCWGACRWPSSRRCLVPRGISRLIWRWCSSALPSWRHRWGAALRPWPKARLIWLWKPWPRRLSRCRCFAVTTSAAGC